MMRRLFWVAAGAAAGILVVQKLSRKARAFTPAGMTDNLTKSVQGIRGLAREFVDDVLAAAADKEDELLAMLEQGSGDPAAKRRVRADQAERSFDEVGRDQKERR